MTASLDNELALRVAIDDNRFRDVAPLTFLAYPDRFLDKRYCEQLAERLLKVGREWEVLPARTTTYKQIPASAGIYMFVWRQYFPFGREESTEYIKNVVYIGKAGDGNSTLRSRYHGEYSKKVLQSPDAHWRSARASTRKERLDQILNLWDLEYWFLSITAYSDELKRLEAELIELFNPPGNVTGKRIKQITARRGKPEPAF